MNKNKKYDLCLATVMLAAFLVISNLLALVPTYIYDQQFYLSVFTFPVTFLIANYITKKYGIGYTVRAIIYAILIQLVAYVIQGCICGEISLLLVYSSLIGFIVSHLVNLSIYASLIKNKTDKFLPIFLSFTIAVLLDNIVFVGIMNITQPKEALLTMLNVSNLIKVIVVFFLTFVNSMFKK